MADRLCDWPGSEVPILSRDFTLADVGHDLRSSGIDQIILVQSEPNEAETRRLLGAKGDIAGVVGWTDLRAPDVISRIDELIALGRLVGIRPMVQDLEDDWYDDPDLNEGMAYLSRRNLVLEALVRPRHLQSLARLADRHPRLKIVVDHAAKPPVGGETNSWQNGIAALAERANVNCKLSGLVTELVQGETIDAVVPLAKYVIATFGANRVIWGSDWPVLTLSMSYAEWLSLAQKTVAFEDRDAVFGGNAERLYGLRLGAVTT